ncbi:MAG: hypothetical protein P1U42_05935 [Phycisphaerales bacterium]|nr:hypothetical protein [Phycisphaerales bacterium]
MNRLSRYLVYLIITIFMALFIVGGQRFVMLPYVYSSIHQIGDRIGRVLPHGHNLDPSLFYLDDESTVTLYQQPQAPVLREGMHPEDPGKQIPSFAGVDLRIPMFSIVVYLAVLFLVSTISLWRTTRYRAITSQRFIGTLVIGASVCVLLATLFSSSRVFWTGVNEAFVNRSLIHIPGSESVRIQGQNLLAMSQTELFMILIAMIMTAIPALVFIDLKLFLPTNTIANTGNTHNSKLSVMMYNRDGTNRFSETAVRTIACCSYVITVLFLWTSPWSTTVVHALLK